jgi:hypothetical protein
VAFDIYAGTFTRFFTRDWENVIQRQARLDGAKYHIVYAGGDEGPPPAESVREDVGAWKAGINAALAQHDLGPLDWSEDDALPYFTDRSSWDGYFSLQHWAAHLEHPQLSVPYFLPEDPTKGPALAATLANDEKLHFRSILQGGVWLPGDFDYLFSFPSLTEEQVMIGSTGRLLQELRELQSKPLPWGKKPLLSFGKKQAVPLQEIAEWSLPIFERVVAQGHAAKLPFMLSC